MVSIASQPRALPDALVPGVSLKRKHSDSDSDENSNFTGLVKRPRVAFDPEVEIRILEDWNDKGSELVREEVRRGLERHAAGDGAGYDQLKQLLVTKPSAEDAPSTPLLRKYILALIRHVNLLNKNSSGLVHAILDCQWILRDESFVGPYMRLLGSLLSAHGGYTGAVLKMIVKHFIELPFSSNRHPDDPAVSRLQLQTRAHQCLKYILRLIPSASSVLSSVVSASFPFATDTTKVHTEYIRNLLRLTKYAPELKGEILALITERLVKIDVQVQVDMEELEEDIEETLVQDVIHKSHHDNAADGEEDEEDPDDSDNESVSSEESVEGEEKRIKELKESVAKMDNILDLLFDYYHPIFARGNAFEIEDVFELMLSQFANTILPTYRSRHTQFLLFHYAQASPALVERFAGACAHLAFDKSRQHFLRLSAAAYLASFIARGAHVSGKVVRDVFELLGGQLEILRMRHEYTCNGPDLRRFAAYYAFAQALLYIFCFRWRDLIIEDDDAEENLDMLFDGRDLTWVPGIKEVLTRNIYSKFNPLKVCSPAIVGQFARIAHHLKFIYVFPLLETNKRLRLSRSVAAASYSSIPERETALSGKRTENALQLDTYFPFDPYHLPRSKRWIEGDYNEWRSIPGLDEPQEEASDSEISDDESDGDDEEAFEDGDGTGTETSG